MQAREKRIGRCMFRLEEKTLSQWNEKFKFNVTYDSATAAQVDAFSNATPFGEMEVMINNSNVTDKLVLGKHYYIDIVEIPTEKDDA